MKRDAKQVNSRGVALALGGGAALLLVATQMVAKPNTPPATGGTVARAAARPATAEPTTVRVASNSLAGSPLVAAAPIRELFRPLVTPPTAAPKTPTLPVAPKLPPATAAKPAPPAPPAAPTSVTPPPATPAGPNTSEIQMLGVVEFSDGVKALLKKTSSGESRYFAKGDDAFGFTVGEITTTDVALSHAGKTDKVAMSTAVPIEGSTGTSVAASSGFGGSSFGGGGDRSNRGGGDRNNRGGGDRNSRSGGDRSNRGGGDTSARSEGGFSTSQIMSLPTWAERLKKLDEIKAQLEPEKYDRLKKFMEGRAAAEKGK